MLLQLEALRDELSRDACATPARFSLQLRQPGDLDSRPRSMMCVLEAYPTISLRRDCRSFVIAFKSDYVASSLLLDRLITGETPTIRGSCRGGPRHRNPVTPVC